MVNPYDDMPSADTEACDLGGCCEPWALKVEARNGPRCLRLCEEHADRWLKAEAELDAEVEEMAGRSQHVAPLAKSMAPLFALAREHDARRRNGRRRAG